MKTATLSQHLPFTSGEPEKASFFTLVLASAWLELLRTVQCSVLVNSHMWLFKLIKMII